MKEIILKDGKSKIYIDDFATDEEIRNLRSDEDRYTIYDSNKRYLTYVVATTQDDYAIQCGLFGEFRDGFDVFDYLCGDASYDYSNIYAQDIMEHYVDDIVCGYELEQMKEEIKDILFDIHFLTDEEFCETYDINKIGDIYFRGNW